MRGRDVAAFLASEVEPVGEIGAEKCYRAAVRLTDGTELPCVAFSSADARTDFALRRFKEERRRRGGEHGREGYRAAVEAFVRMGSALAARDVAAVRKSPHAIPAELYRTLWNAGETSMGFQAFFGLMDDGTEFLFGTSYELMFFSAPEGYSADRLVAVRALGRGDVPNPPRGGYWREMCRFDCYLGEL